MILKKIYQEIFGKFEEENNVNEKTIAYFFNLFNDQKIAITNDKYRDLFKISDFLEVKSFLNRLKRYEKRHFKDIDFIITSIIEELSLTSNQKSSQDKYKIKMEEHLIEHINECFFNNKFKQLPIEIIYRIINKLYEKDKTKISNDLLFDFINGSIEDLFVLYTFVDIRKVSPQKLHEFNEIITDKKNENLLKYLQYLKYDYQYLIEAREIENKYI